MRLFTSTSLAQNFLAIYGTGGFGRLARSYLERCGCSCTCFIDSSFEKWNSQVDGIEVVSPETAVARTRRDRGLIIVASSYYGEIAEVLGGFGLREGVDFVDAVRFAIKEEFQEDGRRLEAYRDRHAGKRAFLVGNGPSLQMSDLGLLKGEICFAANKIYLAYDETDWRPTYYCVCDPRVSLTIQDQIRKLETTKFLANSTCFYGEEVENGFVLPYFFRNRTPADREPRFSEDPLNGIYDGGTVIYMMMQLAYFMGIREMYLIGVDHSFAIPESRNGGLLEGGGQNHFHPDYRPKGEMWSPPDFDFMNRAFAYAGEYLAERGGKIVNVSRKTALGAYPVVDLESVLDRYA